MTTGLHYEVRGDGPVVLLIPGGNGDAGFYEPLARALADRLTVVSYDRRGFSRSPLNGDVGDQRLAKDTDDARGLMELFAGGPADVFGSSSGGIVALELVTRYPDRVRTAVVHEPPIVRLLRDGERILQSFDEVYDTYHHQGIGPAMRKFVTIAGLGPPRFGSLEFWRMVKLMPRIRRNMRFWIENELRQYTRYEPDVAALRKLSTRLLLAGGRDSRELFPHRATTALAELLDTEVVELPGGHAGYRAHAATFADRLCEMLGYAGRPITGRRNAFGR